jgi:acid phosphatase
MSRPGSTLSVLAAAVLLVTACSGASPGGTQSSHQASAARTRSTAPAGSKSTATSARHRGRWDHVVVVIEENHSHADVAGNSAAPFLTLLAATGMSFDNSYGLVHPSEPNYLALFSGSTQGVTDDSCPHSFGADNLGHQLRVAGYSFTGYSEDLPSAGDQSCGSGAYARKHAPWVNFTNLPPDVNQPLTAFPADPAKLPTVAFVVPNLDHDMHDGTIGSADSWLKDHLGSYAVWARTHRSLLVVTFDEDDNSANNQILTLVSGAGVPRRTDNQHITHYDLLRTLEQGYGLAPLGGAAQAAGIRALTGPTGG